MQGYSKAGQMRDVRQGRCAMQGRVNRQCKAGQMREVRLG
jgi:hypothetical protein